MHWVLDVTGWRIVIFDNTLVVTGFTVTTFPTSRFLHNHTLSSVEARTEPSTVDMVVTGTLISTNFEIGGLMRVGTKMRAHRRRVGWWVAGHWVPPPPLVAVQLETMVQESRRDWAAPWVPRRETGQAS
jgi:hypothetical protein